MATSRWAWPRPIGEEMYRARLGRAAPRAQRAGGGGGQAKSRMMRLVRTGSRRCGAWCRHGRASNTRLNGVSAARRNRVKPAAVTTSLILASPACAPSASPTSWDSEAGVHSSVENA